MKIFHKSKRAVPPHPQLAQVISNLLITPNDYLPQVLAQIDSWKWPRSDLNAWINVLNKFDSILEDVIRDYNVDKLQLNVFTPITKQSVCEILRFERLLLENSTNRKMFNSYDRLNGLLFTSDLDVLVLALNLLLRPSQQYSAQPSVSHALNISTPRLQSLAKRWPNLREYGLGLANLNDRYQVDGLPAEAREVNYNFYCTGENKGREQEKKVETDPFDASQSSPRKPASGAINIHIDEQTLRSNSAFDVLADTIETYSVPDEEKFELMCRIRSAQVLAPGNEADREKLVIVRLLAIAIFGHTHSESQAMSSLFLYEPDLIIHIAEVLQIDRDTPVSVQTAAIASLDALARYRNKIQEVLTAVNAGVNHGILMALVRKTVADIENPDSILPHPFIEALLSFLSFISSQSSGGNMVVGAGLVPLLIQIIENRLPHRLPVVSKAMQLVDNVLYSFQNAFQLFCSARGVEVLVDRIEFEVVCDINGDEGRSGEISGFYRELPVARSAVLKHTLRSMHRMMQSSGTAEGLRGLIDSSILKSVKSIIGYRGLFGPSVIPIAINIMATFVHNEPTSLSIIQEAGLPEVFYNVIEAGLEPAIEVIQAIPNAIGALCLNQAGQDQLAGRPSIIPGIFSIFTSDRHLKLLLDKENAVLIGTAIDELIRHHPSLKTSVFESLKSTLSKIEELGEAYVIPQDLLHWYRLSPISSSGNEDVPMEDVETDEDAQVPVLDAEQSERQMFSASTADDQLPKPHDNNVVTYIDVLGRFLEGLFQHVPHCRDFISSTDGLERIGRLTALPCLPYDFANSVASDSLVQVMRTMTEVATNETLLYLAKLVKSSLQETKAFWGELEAQSKLLPLIDITDENDVAANQQFRKLVTLHIRIGLLSDVFATAGYAHGRAAIGLLQTLMGSTAPDIIADLGALHRASIWENIILKVGLTSSGMDGLNSPDPSLLERSPDLSSVVLPDVETSTTPNGDRLESSQQESPPAPRKNESKAESPREQNAQALKHLTHGLPSSLGPLFQAIVKMFYARRNPDVGQRKQIMESSSVLADIMLQHISQDIFDDTTSAYIYYSIMFGVITLFLVDDRTSQNALHTVQLAAFYRVGGTGAVLDVCRRFMSTIETVVKVKAEDRSNISKQELRHAYGGLKMALHLLHPIISSKPIFESGQTLLLITRDKKDTDPDYFDSHNFLVKLRLAVSPLLRDLWEAPWLISAPLSVSKHVVQAVLELTNGENEEPKGEPTPEGLVVGQAGANITRSGPDEGRIRQLTDMGFPRFAAERALIRTQNNVNAATELLLANPFPLLPDPAPEPNEDPVVDVAAPDEADAPAVAAADEAVLADSSAASPSIPSDHPLLPEEPDKPAVEGKSAEDWRKELDVSREPLKAGIGRRALLLVDEHLSLIFDLHSAFVRPADAHQQESIRALVDDIKVFSPSAYDVQEQPLANRCRLLALVLCETPSSLGPEQRNSLMDSLLALLLSNPVNVDVEHPSIPKWLATHLLVTEALLTLGDQPRAITLPKEDEPIVPEAVTAGPSYPEARTIVFDFCMRLLAIPSLPSDELLSVLRLFVLLTRHHQTACQFVQRDGITQLFKRLKSSAVAGSQSYIAIILRHIAEDATILQHVMRQAIKRYFAQPRTHIVEVGTYVRNCSAMALRDSQVFLEVTQSLCNLAQPFSTTPHVSLKGEPVTTDENAPPKAEDAADMQVDSLNSTTNIEPNESSPSESLESLVHFLVNELMKTSKAITEHTLDAPSSEPPIPTDIDDAHLHLGPDGPSNAEGQDGPTNAGTTDHYGYACFLMQCLTELLFSYDSCKVAFLSYSPKKRPQTPAKEVATRHRTAALHFLLSDLISFSTINPQPNPVARNRIMICSWAMSVIVALCVDSSSTHELKDISSDLVSVRKFVLEAINRSIKDLSSSENLDGRYGRLLALADLCHRLLTVRINPASRKQADETPTHIAKVMLEKNFVSTLTNALVEVDLNFPNVRGLVASILRPLEHLSKIAIKMSRASGKAKDSLEGKTDSVDSAASEEEDEDMEATGREETPDLYRNSALGMYGGEMEDVHFSAEDDMDEDDEDNDEDVEMDFGEETGSEDTSNTEDEGEDDLEHDAHGSQEAWDDEGDEDEENLVQNDEDDEEGDDDEGDDDDGDEEGDEEIMWQDIHVDGDVPDDAVDDADEEEGTGEPIQIIHEQEEQEMLSEDEDFGNELGIIEDGTQAGPEYVFGLGDTFGNGVTDNNGRDGGLFVPRRRSVDNMQIFGRPRNGPIAPLEATTHPLLLDASSAANRAPGQQRNRRNQRGVIAGTTNELVQTIEDLIGGGAVQLFHHITTRGRGGGGPETIRLDVPSGTVNVERSHGQRRAAGVLSTSVRVERAPRAGEGRLDSRDFDPLMTLQRWGEETKILHGEFVTDRAAKLADHVSLALLPAAKEAKIREEREMAIRREARAKAEEEAAVKEKEKIEEAARQEAEKAAKRETEESPRIEPDIAAQQPGEADAMEDIVVPAADVDSEMIDASNTALPPSREEPVSEDAVPTGTNESSIVQAGQAESSHAAERVTVMIHGSAVDITDTGIDPTFLEALPDDMREEVLNQHVRDQRASRVERPPDSQISSEFLDALPPEIRAEIIQQERLEQARRRAEETAPDRPAGVPAEIDPASFIASLDPQLRQSVLLEQEEGFIQSLPSHMIAEAGAYRDSSQNPRRQFPTRSSLPRSAIPRKLPPPHDAIQLLDKGGIAVLVRLLFFPQVLRKNLLFKVLVNLCENAKTRTELFNLLLNILQDGTGDLAAVDKSFAQMSVRNAKIPSQQTPKAAGKQRAGTEYFNAFPLPNLQNEAVPDLIAQRCLEALTFIVSSNEMSSLFFLTEHELPAGLRRATSKKGKGKEKQMPQTHYPIVLLLGLLDRQSLLKTPSIMESVVGLLATVTRPLTSIKTADKKDLEPSTSAPAPLAPAPPAPAPSAPALPAPVETSPATSQSSAAAPQQEVEAPAHLTATTLTPPTDAKQEPSIETVEEKILLANPPQIPHAILRLIVNILTIGECSGRTFQQSLALIQHLSYIPDARDVVAQELKLKAQEFGQSLYSDLDELASALQSSQGTVLVTSVASKFSPASSEQAKLLRVLKTIDYMYSPKPATFSAPQGGGDTEKVQGIYESFRFAPLWRRLGDCLAVIEQKPDTEHVATVLLPLIEALMVVCKYVGLKAVTTGAARVLRASASPRTPTTARESMEDLFVTFTDAHRKVLNLMVRNNPSLMSGSFSLLVHNPRVLDFDNKRNYFSQQLHRRPHAREHHGTLQLNVRRARVFEDSFQYLQRKTGDQIKYGKLSVRFYDEEGVDAGGVTREWFQILARQMFDPNNALFQPCAADKLTYQPNKNSWVNPEHLSFFKFVGRVIGKAIYDGRLLDAYFARSLYRQLLGKPVDYKDVEWVDPEYYNSLCWILENDPSALDLTFSVEADEFGRNRIVPLKEEGESLPVTQENKREFVQLSAQYRLYSSIKEQIESLLAGFYEIIPKDLVTIFNEQEVELLISGTPDIDVDEWRAATEYNGYGSSDPVIVWWWRALKSFNRDERAKVLSFATGTSRVPLSGFVDLQGVQGVQRFSIHRAYGDSDRLPQAHTCFNQIDLPQYSTYEMLRQQLLLAINEGGEGFGFA